MDAWFANISFFVEPYDRGSKCIIFFMADFINIVIIHVHLESDPITQLSIKFFTEQ